MKKIIILGIVIALLVIGFFGYKYFINEKQETPDASSDLSLSKIKEKGKLIVGTSLPFPPMEHYDINKRMIGFDIDLIEEIGSSLGVTVEIENTDWDNLFDDVKSGKFDVVINGITVTAERQKDMLFSIPYLNAGQVVLVRKDNEDIKKPEDLKNIKTGVLKESTCEEAAKLYVNPLLIQRYESQDLAIDDLKDKKVDAVIVDYVVATTTSKNDPSLKVVTSQFTEEYYSIATRLDNITLMNEINRILKDFKKNGKIVDIENKWLK